MTKTWQTFTPRQKAVARTVFDAMVTMDAMKAVDEALPLPAAAPAGAGSRERRVGLAELHAFATRRGGAEDDAILAALARDGTLRETFRRLLANISLAVMPRVAAASSGGVDSREGDNFLMTFKFSRADPSQVYVTIRMTAPGLEAPESLFIVGGASVPVKHPLPEVQDGIIQILAEADSDLVRALRDTATEVFLR